jgi:hypothetical protein
MGKACLLWWDHSTGQVSNSILKPAFDGVVFNWNADYARDFRNFDFHINGSLSHSYIDTYDSSSGLIEFNSQATIFAVHADTRHPTDLSFVGFPMALLVYYGGTTFLGQDRDQMGFTYFVEGGLALEADIGRLQKMIKRLNVGAKLMYGEDVNG